MYPHILLGIGAAAVFVAVTVFFVSIRAQQQQSHGGREPDLPPPDRMDLGPCGMCDGDVSALDGFRATCGHFVHYTCNADATRPFRDVKCDENVWRKICRACLKHRIFSRRQSQPNNIGDLGPCGMCDGDVSALDGFRATCGHFVHYTCNADATRPFRDVKCDENVWRQICRACLKHRIFSRRQSQPNNIGLRRRIDTHKCAICISELADGEQDGPKTLPCRHRVHRACWERMETSGLTTCPTCAENY